MIRRLTKVLNRAGLHARPASILVQACQKYKCGIWIERGDDKINAKSIMSILAMGAAYETELMLVADGEDELEAIEELAGLFARKFN